MIICIAWVLATLGLAALIIAIRLIWVWRHIRTHAQVEPLHIACPSLDEDISQLVKKISELAGIDKPPLIFIKRSHLPNAFVIAAIMRPEIYLSDELLEEASVREDGVKYLIKVLCHEIAHIKRNDSIRVGLWTIAKQCSCSCQCLTSLCVQKLMQVELKTHKLAHEIEMQIEPLIQSCSSEGKTNHAQG